MDVRWTAEQVEAVTTSEDALLAASAGTGKTTTIVGKILWQLGLPIGESQVDGQPIPPCPSPSSMDQIAAITFTEKAAHDLKAKLRRAIESTDEGSFLRWELDRATVGTIHGFCADLLRDHALRLDVDPTFGILDERETRLEQDRVIREMIHSTLAADEPGTTELVKRFGLSGWRMQPGAIGRVREVMRDLRWRPRQYDAWLRSSPSPIPGGTEERELDLEVLRQRAREAGAWEDSEAGHDDAALSLAAYLYRLARRAAHAWLEWLERENVRDFDSLILDARRLLTRPETRPALEAIQSRYRLLIIDEFQDTDRAQWEIARAVAGLRPSEPTLVPDGPSPGPGPQLLVVGDPKQSIYRFRGADVGVWNEALHALCPGGNPLHLSHNFRSEPRLVEFVNRIGGQAFTETAEAIGGDSPEHRVEYQTLHASRPASSAAGLEWLATDGAANQAARAELEGRLVATRIHQLIADGTVIDPDSGVSRPCEHRDIAILGRRNADLATLEQSLRSYGIPFFNSATGGLADQQEVLDLVTALRIIDNPFDDLRAFAFLRSPFVGLRDEVLARIGLDPFDEAGRGAHPESFLARAEAYSWLVEQGTVDWFEAPESPHIGRIERRALQDGLSAVRDAQQLVDRADVVEVLEKLLEATGYRLHLELREGSSEALANIERFLALLEEYRHLPVGRFLELWDRWEDEDLGIPQARLYSSGDDVVTLSTIHGAKGLEWPVVILVNAALGLVSTGRLTNAFWTDSELGPVFMPLQAERGARSRRALERWIQHEEAEAARLLYVGMTRSRDRLIVAGTTQDPGRRKSFGGWLAEELPDAKEAHETGHLGVSGKAGENDEADKAGRPRQASAADDDPVTGTGRQIDAFGFDARLNDERGQFDLFTSPSPVKQPEAQNGDVGPNSGPEWAAAPMVIYRGAASIQTSLAALPASLDWLEGIEPGEWPEEVGPISVPSDRLSTSATEIMMREQDPERWTLRYRHGVLLKREFLDLTGAGGALPPTVRGTLIHGVLERIREAEELSDILNETIATIELADLENILEAGSPYRTALEHEIERVVRSPEWEWYLEGEPHRELPFVHFRGRNEWLGGALDLYRPPVFAPMEPMPEAQATSSSGDPSLFGPSGVERERMDREAWIIDFKTHEIEARDVDDTSREYLTQARVYREAAEALVASAAEPAPRVRIALHFTHPNVAREM
jgi:ATP-dependent exoDNAse (exonuclease V) beta subunit